MQWVAGTQWVRIVGKSHLTHVEPIGPERTRVPPRQGPYEAGWSEKGGRVSEPRNG